MALSSVFLSTSAATGGAGVATGSAVTLNAVRGVIIAVYVKYLDSPPAGTTDIVLKTTGTASGAAPSLTILTLTNAATDGWFYPRVQEHDSTGTAITGAYDWAPVYDTLTATMTGANNDDYAELTVLFEAG